MVKLFQKFLLIFFCNNDRTKSSSLKYLDYTYSLKKSQYLLGSCLSTMSIRNCEPLSIQTVFRNILSCKLVHNSRRN